MYDLSLCLFYDKHVLSIYYIKTLCCSFPLRFFTPTEIIRIWSTLYTLEAHCISAELMKYGLLFIERRGGKITCTTIKQILQNYSPRLRSCDCCESSTNRETKEEKRSFITWIYSQFYTNSSHGRLHPFSFICNTKPKLNQRRGNENVAPSHFPIWLAQT